MVNGITATAPKIICITDNTPVPAAIKKKIDASKVYDPITFKNIKQAAVQQPQRQPAELIAPPSNTKYYPAAHRNLSTPPPSSDRTRPQYP